MNDELLSLLSEINELKDLIAATPKDYIIDRISLEARLEHVTNLLNEFSETAHVPKAKLIFNGQPVLGGHGMFASFGSEASKKFIDLFTITMADISGIIQNKGRIPSIEGTQPIITGTIAGSFGFEFEFPPPIQGSLFKPTAHEDAMRKITTLLRLSVEVNEDNLTEAVDEMHLRTTNKISSFLKLLVDRRAWCGIEFEDDSFYYKNYQQVELSHGRFKGMSAVDEEDEEYLGEIQGILPDNRKFEFKLYDKDKPIIGKINSSIENPEIMNKKWLHVPAKIKLKVTRPTQGNPRYMLMSLDDLSSGDF